MKTFYPARDVVLVTMKQINSLIFDDRIDLDRVEVVIEDLDTEWGYCIKEEEDPYPVLGVADEFPTATDLAETLAHEMVHLYQYQILKMEPDHGKTFKEFKNKAKDVGYNIIE
jgi:hypothetical protein